jgi:hypothetical protein
MQATTYLACSHALILVYTTKLWYIVVYHKAVVYALILVYTKKLAHALEEIIYNLTNLSLLHGAFAFNS